MSNSVGSDMISWDQIGFGCIGWIRLDRVRLDRTSLDRNRLDWIEIIRNELDQIHINGIGVARSVTVSPAAVNSSPPQIASTCPQDSDCIRLDRIGFRGIVSHSVGFDSAGSEWMGLDIYYS